VEHELRPGQLWVWAFEHSNGWWPFEVVTSSRRSKPFEVGPMVVLNNGDTFMVVSPDDDGPAQQMTMSYDENGLIERISPSKPKRWHVVLAKGVCIWIEHKELEMAELLVDT
jgi:hypothetical protein